ncbi:MAG: hypothetical protein A2942_00450 [Candidatus Lloydbacteria bacterium RIFCSPLOWO2_01_FULL_50_20]|uniref:Uncharacterized protein n=1 Tax=Candidatus Lloydbacteria bacterium RIFCSPLOWO2_01_FULL_50_20 TaxID=1798665 RepID=A0A1G2DCA3_9BACT|nr:MAG: hypothetical protein A3C13_02190 [Candidatus Lloydbacteria bacterium RIFCSPHIGHO2_02_FULL_50_11]OGZ11249.1 MAG: hypothetical protein A2942_00450 [Candidatus Lloydbacteria bacterium RIFCSPLOWO2_01_FULL_50_20]
MDNPLVCHSHVVDQRGSLWEEKMMVNRERFRKRYDDAIKRAVKEQLSGKGITDITGDGDIVVEIDLMSVPRLRHDPSSAPSEKVFPGNIILHKGDKIPKQGGGSGSGKGKSGHGQEAGQGGGGGRMRLPLTKEEWIGYVFQDLELPNLVLKMLTSSDELRLEQRGFSSVGPAHLLDLKRTILRSDGRLQVIEQQIEDDLDEERKKMKQQEAVIAEEEAKKQSGSPRWRQAQMQKGYHLERIRELENELGVVPQFEKMDLRYRHHEMIPVPVTEAVVFFHLDVSGSMSEKDKLLALTLFRFEYLFLTKLYRRVHLVLIHYHGEAYECQSVEEFFGTSGTGGTEYSCALELHQKIQEERFPASQYNIYVTHASDGDNFTEDREKTIKFMNEVVLPRTQYYVYVQIGNERKDTEFWRTFSKLQKPYPQLTIAALTEPREIIPVFRKLFKKKGVKVK